MFNQIQEIARRYPSLVLAAIVLSIGFLFSVYKMSTAFNEREATPEYQNSPAAGLNLQPAVSIIDTEYISGINANKSRLPDDDYRYLFTTSKRLARDIAANRQGLDVAFVDAGMRPAQAREAARNVDDAMAYFAGQSVDFPGDEALSPGSDKSATVTIPVVFSPTGNSAEAATDSSITLSFRPKTASEAARFPASQRYLLDDVQPPVS